MRNQPVNQFDGGDALTTTMRPWEVDSRPAYRLGWLFFLMVFPLGFVAVRLAQLQVLVREGLTTFEDVTTTSFERLPSVTGRVLSADGVVLAHDLPRFTLMLHYRWLEEPADPGWLRQQALSRLAPAARRDRERVRIEQQHVLALRRALWNRVAARTGVSSEDLTERRAAIQRRVERIAARVDARRQKADDDAGKGVRNRLCEPDQDESLSTEQFAQTVPDTFSGWWQPVVATVIAALTTPPEREELEPVVVREELAYHPLIEDVPLETVIDIESHPTEFPGLRYRVTHRRIYPEGSLAAHVVGNRTRLASADAAAPTSDSLGEDALDEGTDDALGRTGVESAYERYLHGVTGRRKLVRNGRGEIIHAEIDRAPRAGHDVELTLNLPLQRRMESLLDQIVAPTSALGGSSPGKAQTPADVSGPTGGCILVLDAHTGAVLAAASAPRFNLNLLDRPDPDDWQRLTTDPRHPFLPRLTHLQLPPGSAFKPLTAVAVLESGRIDPDEPIHCRGYLDEPDRNRCLIYRHYGVGHGDVTLEDALCRSCNVYFFTAARRIGPEAIVEWAERFGFGQATGIDLPGEYAGSVPCPPALRREKEKQAVVQAIFSPFAEDGGSASPPVIQTGAQETWYPGDTLGLAIGQSRLTVTPLQIVRMMAAIANGGYLVTPHVVRRIHPSSANDADTANLASDANHAPLTSGDVSPPPVPIRGLSPATLQRVRDGLSRVVSHPQGTGHRSVYLEDVSIAGKTGTAETGRNGEDHAWFVGYVPADAPRFAFVVVLERGGSGGAVAGPPARKVVETMLDLGLLSSPRETSRE